MISPGRVFPCLLLAVSASLAAGPAAGQASAAAFEPRELAPAALVQLDQVYFEKSTRTAAQQKLSTPLVYAVRELARDAVMRDLPSLRSDFQKDKSDRLEVDLKTEVTAELLQAIEDEGGSVVSSFPQYRAVRAYLPVAALERIAERAEVRHIRPATRPMIWSAADKKMNTSQGDVAHAAPAVRASGVDGTGVKVCVISDSVDPGLLVSLKNSGDLPKVTLLNPLDPGTGNSEGTAMLEIIHDLAPGAELYFATATGGEQKFADNIAGLKGLGCRVIVDDASYVTEPVFQDGIVAKAVTDAGVAYFSSAGNAGNLSSGLAGAWEGDFKAGGTATLGAFTSGTIHDFGGGVLFNPITFVSSSTAPITLQWSDPFDHSGADYDLCLVNAAGTQVLGCSTDVQNGDDDPIEGLTPKAGARVAIINRGGTQPARFLHLSGNRSRFQIVTSGQTSGHSAEASAFSIAAVNVATAGGGAFVGGAANPVEGFSSDGPRRIFFTANGTPITPGNFLASGGTVRQKPDFAAADGVATASSPVGGPFNLFFGTSAAAPHAAAIAALMLDSNPSLSPAALRSALQAGALDIMAAGVDRNSGFGVLSAKKAVDAAGTAGSCVRDADTACLQNGRFEVEVDQTASPGGKAQVMSFNGQRAENDESAFWWFSVPTNFEMGVKVLNACGLGNKFWVFASGLTNQQWTLRVRDTQTNATRIYSNPANHLSTTFADTAAFACP